MRSPEVVSALPNIYNKDQLYEFSAASNCSDISDEEAARVELLYESNYGLERVRESGLASTKNKTDDSNMVQAR